MKGDGTYTKLVRNDSEKRTTYLFTPLPGGLTTFAVGPPISTHADHSRVVLEGAHTTNTTRPKGSARRGTEGTMRGARGGSRRGGGGGGSGGGSRGGRRRRHFDMKKKEKKRVLPGEPAGLYIHINAG